jgi:UDP-N-acetylglucosamine transferase subunit ALG13
MISSAKHVIAHGGVGTFKMCISNGKYPILIPRLVELKEHTDPSQPIFCREVHSRNLGYYVDDLTNQNLLKALRVSASTAVRREAGSPLAQFIYKSIVEFKDQP